MKSIIAASLFTLFLASEANAASSGCTLVKAPDKLPSGYPWYHDAANRVAAYTAPIQRDDDGAPNAYHPCGANYPDAVCGTTFGLDHICSGVTVEGADGKIIPRSIGHSSKACLAGFREAEANHFPKCGQHQACVTEWPAIVLKGGQPQTWPDGPYKGYYVSTTTLERADPTVPGEARSLDARRVPYVVVPGKTVLTQVWRFGSHVDADLALVIVPSAHGPAHAAFAVVGDTGGPKRLGEGSVELLRELRNEGQTPPPFQERPAAEPINSSVVILFRNSHALLAKTWPAGDLDSAIISEAGQKALASAGGLSVVAHCLSLGGVDQIKFVAQTPTPRP